MLTLHDVSIDNKRVVVRVDFNVPITSDKVDDDSRLKATVPTIEYCIARNAEVVLVSHLGRPKGQTVPELSLLPVARQLEKLLGRAVNFLSDSTLYLQDSTNRRSIAPGKISLLENLRFDPGEEANNEELGTNLGRIGDVYVFEAFGTAHRAHASTSAAIRAAPISCAGLLVTREVGTLSKIMDKPQRPLVAVMGGSKISGKLEVLERLGTVADSILVGGGLANTLLLAQGNPVGHSLVETKLLGVAKKLLANASLALPVDVMVCKQPLSNENAIHRLLNQVEDDDMIVDVGPETARRFSKTIASAGTILWNGPLGMFEIDQYGEGTRAITLAVGNSSGYSVVGGGDTLAAIAKFGTRKQFDYISTGGGAFLEFIEGKKLPALEQLRAKQHELYGRTL